MRKLGCTLLVFIDPDRILRKEEPYLSWITSNIRSTFPTPSPGGGKPTTPNYCITPKGEVRKGGCPVLMTWFEPRNWVSEKKLFYDVDRRVSLVDRFAPLGTTVYLFYTSRAVELSDFR